MSDSIIFAPDLDIDVEAFAEFWNDSEFAEYGLAMPQDSGRKSFELSPEMAVALVGVAGSLTTAVLTLATTEYFARKARTAAKAESRTVTTTTIADGQGNTRWVVTKETVTT